MKKPAPHTTPLIRYYGAVSLDGFIADPDGGVEWLDAFHDVDYGRSRFMRQIGGYIMGRRTFDKSLTFGTWPFKAADTVVVLTTKKLRGAPTDVVAAHTVDEAIALTKTPAGKDIWMMGGGIAATAFLEAGRLDRIELFVMPILLCEGIPLFAPSTRQHRLRLRTSQTYKNGVVYCEYEPRRS